MENAIKPIKSGCYEEYCGKCRARVQYAQCTGSMYYGASESYEGWTVITHDFCPRCGTKVDRTVGK